MTESSYKFSVWSSTEFLESDYDFLYLSKKTKNNKKRKLAGGGGLTPGRKGVRIGLESGVLLCSRWDYNWGSLEVAVYGLG